MPEIYRGSDNSRKLSHCRRAVKIAADTKLTPAQQRRLRQYYIEGLSKSEIARLEKSSCSTVAKSLKAAEGAIREYAGMYMDIYDKIEKELLSEHDF